MTTVPDRFKDMPYWNLQTGSGAAAILGGPSKKRKETPRLRSPKLREAKIEILPFRLVRIIKYIWIGSLQVPPSIGFVDSLGTLKH